jgi:hypothetical protein
MGMKPIAELIAERPAGTLGTLALLAALADLGAIPEVQRRTQLALLDDPQANADWKQAQDGKCITPGANDDGSGGTIAALGRRANSWRLVNLAGNVPRWVGSVGKAMLHGGSSISYHSNGTVVSHRDDNDTAEKDVGSRVLGKLK